MNTAKRTILAIDDDPEWLDFIAVVTGDEYLLKSSVSANEVVRLAKEIKPAVITLDVMMKDHKDGFTAFSELQKDPDCKHIPVIIFSEVNAISELGFDLTALEDYIGARPAAFLEKPVTAEKFLEAIRTAVEDAEGLK